MNNNKITNRLFYKDKKIEEKILVFHPVDINTKRIMNNSKTPIFRGQIYLDNMLLYETDFKHSREAVRQSFVRWYEAEHKEENISSNKPKYL